MDNPHWSTEGKGHHIDLQQIKLSCFELLNIFEANKSLYSAVEFIRAEAVSLGDHDADVTDTPLLQLHRDFSEIRIRQLLLQLALQIRTFDDLNRMGSDATQYETHAAGTDGEDYIGSLTEGGEVTPLGLREACNKIIHATEVRPLYDRVDSIVTGEEYFEPETFWHLTGEIELKGQRRGSAWDATFVAQHFIEIALDRIDFQPVYPEPKSGAGPTAA